MFSQSHFHSLTKYSEASPPEDPHKRQNTKNRPDLNILHHGGTSPTHKRSWEEIYNYLLPVTTPRIILNKQSEYLSALHDPNSGHRTPGPPTKTCKGLQLPYAPLPLSPQPKGSNSRSPITRPGWQSAHVAHLKHSSSQLEPWQHTFATLSLCHTAKRQQKKRKLHAVRYFC